ncbi:RagB/SusD family nutrient uptake outer membrane protein [Niabella insulamsoli]|uniref:RagB/SusD family nutrient uptake outer membrane protein n=1 Tax=Niabella insulamsoli TaxID=3144874 RepID=UPI0031FD8B7C
MKKNILKQIVMAALLLSAFTGCKKWLDLKPLDGIVGDEFWQTKEQVDAAVTGIYASMLASGDSRSLALTEYMFIWGEARADMVTPGSRANQDELDIVNLNILPTNLFANWAGFYKTINYCNVLIQLAPEVLSRDNTFTQQHLDRAVGQALAVRSLMYFYLVRVFRDVPLKLDATVSDDDITPIPKSASNIILDQIVADLKEAEQKLPLSYGGTASFDKGRITRYGVNAILADVYLWMEHYAEAAAECDKIINANAFSLVAGGDFFTDIFLTGASRETIFELQYDQQILNPFYNMHTPSRRRWSGALHLPEEVFGLDLVNAEPQLDYRGEDAAYRGGDFGIWKYVGADNEGGSYRTLDQSFAPWVFYRLADALLMKAEAINQLDQPLEASRLVKAIRARGRALEITPMDSTDKSAMQSFILEERQREFAFEGKRWFDLLRAAKRNNYEGISFLLNSAAISVPASLQQAAFNKLRDPNSHYLPIYAYELQTNPLLEQNPYYK